ncbi:hypothetical protein [Acidisoma cladoniae]|jgi:hypothetical protein|uniref:hypothetical protein n=1 Tax=Acidisoma cladoniae TaxID=3040935 RepID=UPI002550FFD9|nr:hypothetical protein [Acidisoma sp. PAMC 29798]
MIGDQNDMMARLRAVLPTGWFPDETPVLNGVLSGLAVSWAWLYRVIGYAMSQTRLATATDGWLDLIARDFGGARWAREPAELDAAFRTRVGRNLRRLRGTRAAVVGALTDLTGRVPIVFEPAYPPDTGGWGSAGLGFNSLGGWGSLTLPYQCFITAYRPTGGGIANTGGYGGDGTTAALGGWNAGALQWGNLDMIEGRVTDAQIYAGIADAMPTAAIAWTTISN